MLAPFCAGCGRSKINSHSFSNSVLAAITANDISFELPRIQQQEGAIAAEKKEKEMVALMETSLAEAKNVSDEMLDKLHPQLKRFYRENLIRGQTLYLEGLRDGDPSKQAAAVRTMMAWGEFWGQNKNSIVEKLD